MNRDSDLIAIPYIIGLLAAVLVVMAGFFLVGAAVGFPMLIIAMAVVGYVAYRGLSANGGKSGSDS
jgi:hypothetical protein